VAPRGSGDPGGLCPTGRRQSAVPPRGIVRFALTAPVKRLEEAVARLARLKL